VLTRLLDLPTRRLDLVADGDGPAVYYLHDREIGGVLINTPPFDPIVADTLNDAGGVAYVFFPSRLGARDVDRWREALGAETLAHTQEAPAIDGTLDIVLDNRQKLTRTIDFLLLPGRTRGTCALRLKNKPAVLFVGPALEPDAEGWPTLVQHADDYSFEDKLFAAVTVQGMRYEYLFTDTFQPGRTRFGPAADAAVARRLDAYLAD